MEETERREEVRRHVEEIRPQRPPVDFQPIKEENKKRYILTVTDNETQFTVGVEAPNIMIGLKRFAEKFKNDCEDWFGLSIMIEEIEFI